MKCNENRKSVLKIVVEVLVVSSLNCKRIVCHWGFVNLTTTILMFFRSRELPVNITIMQQWFIMLNISQFSRSFHITSHYARSTFFLNTYINVTLSKKTKYKHKSFHLEPKTPNQNNGISWSFSLAKPEINANKINKRVMFYDDIIQTFY